MDNILGILGKEFGFSVENPISSWTEALRWNGTKFLHGILTSFHETGDETPYIADEAEPRGGIIIFSTTVNALIDKAYPDKSAMQRKIMSLWATITNTINKNKKLTRILKKKREEKIFGFSIGNFFKGRYNSDDGGTYDETSTCIEIVGISYELLCTLGAEICKSFQQESVLVKDNQGHRILFVRPR
jgi:hypothetical protein